MVDPMYVCVKCGAKIQPGENECKCGSTVFIKTEVTTKPRKGSIKLGKSIENIRITRKGVFEIDLDSLAKSKSLIIKDERGVYYVFLPIEFPVPNYSKDRRSEL